MSKIDYIPTEWINGFTPVNEDNLNHIEDGIVSISLELPKLVDKQLADYPLLDLNGSLSTKRIYVDDNGEPSQTTLEELYEKFSFSFEIPSIKNDIKTLQDNESTLLYKLSEEEDFNLQKTQLREINS